MRTVAIIPARGGSKGLSRKNVREFAGRPLIVHTIQHALGAPQVDAVYVSTEDAEIAAVAREAGATVIDRPAELAGDAATTESAVEHALSVIEPAPDVVCLLQATSPLRPEHALQEALEKFVAGGYDSLLSLSPTHRFFWRVEGDTAVAEYDYMNRPRRQDMRPEDVRYVENGSLYVFTREHFAARGNRLGGRIGCVVFPEEYALEIDSAVDLAMLEAAHRVKDEDGR
jgi:CMP-N,N'-diacetyllegionaminic acid synthase